MREMLHTNLVQMRREGKCLEVLYRVDTVLTPANDARLGSLLYKQVIGTPIDWPTPAEVHHAVRAHRPSLAVFTDELGVESENGDLAHIFTTISCSCSSRLPTKVRHPRTWRSSNRRRRRKRRVPQRGRERKERKIRLRKKVRVARSACGRAKEKFLRLMRASGMSRRLATSKRGDEPTILSFRLLVCRAKSHPSSTRVFLTSILELSLAAAMPRPTLGSKISCEKLSRSASSGQAMCPLEGCARSCRTT